MAVGLPGVAVAGVAVAGAVTTGVMVTSVVTVFVPPDEFVPLATNVLFLP